MGKLIKSRRLWKASLAAAVLAALIWFSSWAPSHLTAWLSAKTTDELYVFLHWAIWAVIIGVIIEEIKLFRHVWKFAAHTIAGRTRDACRKAWEHKDELFEGIGFAILVGGLVFELEISQFIETSQKAELEKQRTLTIAAIGQTESLSGSVSHLGTVITAKQAEITAQIDAFNDFANGEKTRADKVFADLKATSQRFDNTIKDAREAAGRAESALAATAAIEKELRASVATIGDLRQQLHDLTADRIIDVKRLAGHLKSFGKIPVVLEITDDDETNRLTLQLISALDLAEWNLQDNKPSDNSLEFVRHFLGKPQMRVEAGRGIAIRIAERDFKNLGDAEVGLYNALQQENLKNVTAEREPDEQMEFHKWLYGVIHIRVGLRY
jgi:hypothetical protein